MKTAKLLLISLVSVLFSLAINAQNTIPRPKDMLDAASVQDESRVHELKLRIDMLDKPEKGDRKAARSQNEMGLKLLAEKNFADAVKILEKALAADQSDVEIRNNLGYALMKAAKYDAARNVYFDALAIAPGRSGAWFNLGEVLGHLGDKSNSIAAFDIAYSFSQNKEKTNQFLQKLIIDPASPPTLVAAAKQAANNKGVNDEGGQLNQSASGPVANGYNQDIKSEVSQTSLAEKNTTTESRNRCTYIQRPADKAWCLRTEINQKNKELDELKLRYKITDQIIPSCTGLKEGAYEECRLKNIQEAIDQINLNAAEKIKAMPGNQQVEAIVSPIAPPSSAVVDSATENSSTVPATVVPLTVNTENSLDNKGASILSKQGERGKYSGNENSLLPEPVLSLYQFGRRLLIVIFLLSPIVGIYLHRKGVLVLYANYTDAVFTCTFPILLIVAVLFSVLVSRTLGYIANADNAVLNVLDAAVFYPLVIYGVYIVIRETFFSNGLNWKFLLSLSAKFLLVVLFYLSLVLIFSRGRGKHADETMVQYDKYKNQQHTDNLIVTALSTSAFGLLISYVCRDDRFVSFSEYLSLFRRSNQGVTNIA